MTVEEQNAELARLNEERKSQKLEPLTELPAPPAADIDDAKIFEALSKKLGKTVTSYEDLTPKAPPTPEEIQKQKEERATKRTVWALTNGKVTEAELSNFIKEGGNVEGLAYADFAAKRKAANAELEEDDIKAEFETLKEKVGADTILELGNTILQKKYGKFLSLDNEYAAHETKELTTAQFNKKFAKEAPAFISANNAIVDGYQNTGFEIAVPTKAGGEPLKFIYKPTEEVATKIKAAYNSDEKIGDAVNNGYDREKQEYLIKATAVNLDLAGFAEQIAQQATEQREAILRGIPPAGGFQRKELPDEEEVRVKGNKETMAAHYGLKS